MTAEPHNWSKGSRREVTVGITHLELCPAESNPNCAHPLCGGMVRRERIVASHPTCEVCQARSEPAVEEQVVLYAPVGIVDCEHHGRVEQMVKVEGEALLNGEPAIGGGILLCYQCYLQSTTVVSLAL